MEADELFSGVLTDIGESIDYNPDGLDPVLTIFDYVEAMRCQLWDTAFYIELGGNNGAHKNNLPKKQPFFFKPSVGFFTGTFDMSSCPGRPSLRYHLFFPTASISIV